MSEPSDSLVPGLQGVGVERSLRIYPDPCKDSNHRTPTAARCQGYSRDVWLACQLEGGEFQQYGLEEIEDMVGSKNGLPHDLIDVHKRR